MGPVVAAAIPAGAEILSGILGSAGQASANRANLAIAREQMQFQERMSNTQYQRAMADMKAAGLNPLLAYEQGGAGAPVGQTATMENVAAPFASSVRGAGELALNSARTARELEILKQSGVKAKYDAQRAEWEMADARRNYLLGNFDPEDARSRSDFLAAPRQGADSINWNGLAARAIQANIENTRAGASSARAAARLQEATVPERQFRSSLGDLLRRFTDTANRGYRMIFTPSERR